MATVLSHTEGEEVCEIVGDLTDAYVHTCQRVIRKMRWEPNCGNYGRLTVHDTVESRSKDFVKAFHLHCQSQPFLRDGAVIIESGTHQLVCNILSPKNAKIELIGGEGRQFEVDGVNYDTPDKEHTEAGWGQIVITDQGDDTHTEFLVELEIVKKENT
ncbi:MAG: hypothetical protein J6B71_09655 [Clostridia bacterium]|nr:hypothetical protein [Clostridia bacterium]